MRACLRANGIHVLDQLIVGRFWVITKGLYRMVAKVSHLDGVLRMLPDEGDRTAGYEKSGCPV